jgi:hypothetical protein
MVLNVENLTADRFSCDLVGSVALPWPCLTEMWFNRHKRTKVTQEKLERPIVDEFRIVLSIAMVVLTVGCKPPSSTPPAERARDTPFSVDVRWEAGGTTSRKIAIATAEVTTLAGAAGLPFGLDGTGSAASFTDPSGIATDGINLFVALSARSNRERKHAV